MAWSIGAEAIHATLDHVLHEEDVIPLREAVLQIDGVKKSARYTQENMVITLLLILKVSVDIHYCRRRTSHWKACERNAYETR